ncbi:fused MFS/spermidine synthase [Bifidobacterium mongoliense]|jgi:spermidine synthase|uniref:Spermidine synthase n=1 Tax=Bifidobacterium mongoliense TaxID=518643 RepID=A0A423UDC0_9BIFI|nr:fused MFS/spermidine synthase [Bifidobacterium mongoliense]MDN5633038.1 fused MFS/spermidine synthase [Bifidobacterium mongoliense]MDN6553697.1 fused MFS/spermidine synthase [Bifidobacterium mongoliense]MDN6802922.1 fused MFS/spermidine synthase [Bifidobacterium mongoliense]ROT86699.1 spermidine synthase [Bifidobacterium mongoliense]
MAGTRIVTRRDRPILRSTLFLYVTEFFSGMAVMAAELGASRLLAPYFSSSQIVWTIIIGTIMIALALGSIWGGRQSDRNPDPDRIYTRILAAAVWIALIPLVGKYVIIAVSGLLIVTVSTNFLVVAAFISCMIVFVPPLFLLGTVTPGLVKNATDSLDDNATVVGRLSACNTIGSILGTFLPTFVTIPAVGTFVTFLIFSGLLLALALAYFIASRARPVMASLAAVLFVVSAVASPQSGFAFWEKDLAHEGESIYNYLQVKRLSDRTILSTNVLFGVQSVTTDNPGPTGMYYDTALAAPALAGRAGSALILGMGTGTYARQLRRYHPDMRITGVEIDQRITDLAHRYFDEPGDIPVSTYDGRAWLHASSGRYDVIMVDAYQDITIPFQMSSTEFFELVRRHLNPGGVMVVNMNMISDGRDSINAALTDTIAVVFGHDAMLTADVPGTTNRELFARVPALGERAGVMSSERAAARLRAGAHGSAHAEELGGVLEGVASRLVAVPRPQTGARMLTDDRAPVELLGMRAIDELIARQAGPYREIVRTKGPQGLLDMR